MNPTLTNLQRFRISVIATQMKEDIDKLAAVVEEVWNDPYSYAS